MKLNSVIGLSLATANNVDHNPQDNRVIKVMFEKHSRRTSKYRIVPQKVVSETVRFDGKYSPAVRLSLLAAGTALTWGAVFGLANLLLN